MLKSNTVATTTLTPPLKWFGVCLGAWLCNTLSPHGVGVGSWAEWQSLLLAYGLNGVLIGTWVGVGQAWVFGRPLTLKAVALMAGLYALALPAGLGLASAVAFATWPAGVPMLTPQGVMQLSLSNAAPLGALLIGLGQWVVWRGQPLPTTARVAGGWVLANLLGLALGGILATVVWSFTFSGPLPAVLGPTLERAAVGGAVGLCTAYALHKLTPAMP